MKEAERSAAPPPAPKAFSLIGDAKLKQIYAAMVKCRMLDGCLRQMHRQSRSKYISSAGYEAAIVGAAIDLRREDWLIARQWESAASFVNGVPLATIFTGRSGRVGPLLEIAAATGKPVSPEKIVPPIPSLAAQLDIAAGIALAERVMKKGVVMAFCESTPGSPPQTQTALRFIAEHRLPLLLVMQSGKPSNRSPSGKKKQAASMVIRAKACGIPVIPVDRADVVAMYRVAFESIHKARHDGGPTVIEAVAWELPAKDRARKAEEPADPILKMEAYLAGKGLFSHRWKQSLINRFERDLEASLNTSRSKDT
jgi:pyruvate dehydrogenase E1 component alpha subunit